MQTPSSINLIFNFTIEVTYVIFILFCSFCSRGTRLAGARNYRSRIGFRFCRSRSRSFGSRFAEYLKNQLFFLLILRNGNPTKILNLILTGKCGKRPILSRVPFWHYLILKLFHFSSTTSNRRLHAVGRFGFLFFTETLLSPYGDFLVGSACSGKTYF